VPGASVQAFFGNAFFGRIVDEIPAPGVWDYTSLNFDADIAFTDAKEAATFNATNPDLSAFRQRNRQGRIIMWHGWEDPAISALSSINYFEQMANASPGNRSFFRLFMAPGMTHCGGGPGPNAFGQSLAQARPLNHDPENDILSALERWVEQGVPPERVVAVKYVNDNPALGILRTRPLCAYPKTAVYVGSGSTDDAANFDCRQPNNGRND